MRVDSFDFDLPQDRIALRPVSPRDSARLLEIKPSEVASETILGDHRIYDLPNLLLPGDLLIFNNTRVIPARLLGRRVGRGDTEPKIEVTLHKHVGAAQWLAFAKPGKKLQENDVIAFDETNSFSACVKNKGHAGEIELDFCCRAREVS